MNLAGELRVRPGGALPTITSTRPEGVPRLAEGREPEAVPALLGAVFALCGGAHRVAAQLAVRAAQGDAEVDAVQRRALREDTLREHLRRLWIDAPALLPDLPAPALAPLATTRAAVEAAVLGQDVEDWLRRWQADPAGFAAAWARQGGTWPARWLHALRERTPGWRSRVVALLPHASPHELQRLAVDLQADEAFARTPTWRGHTAETGSWTRLAQRGLDAAELWLRPASRIAEIARLVAPGGERWLSLGAVPTGPRSGLAWCEMARGLLLHAVSLDAQGRVQRYRLVAPTEWNFHPRGAVARALALLPPHADPARVRLLAAAYDPCVAVHIEDACHA